MAITILQFQIYHKPKKHCILNIYGNNIFQSKPKISILFNSLAYRLNGRKISRFETSPLMSTYLVAFLISDFPCKEKFTENGFRYRVFAQPNLMKYADSILSESEKILNTISDYLQVDFPLQKLDQAFIPDYELESN